MVILEDCGSSDPGSNLGPGLITFHEPDAFFGAISPDLLIGFKEKKCKYIFVYLHKCVHQGTAEKIPLITRVNRPRSGLLDTPDEN